MFPVIFLIELKYRFDKAVEINHRNKGIHTEEVNENNHYYMGFSFPSCFFDNCCFSFRHVIFSEPGTLHYI